MDYTKIRANDYGAFHELMNAYYRDGEDADTPQEEIDAFIHLLFDKVISREIDGLIIRDESNCVGFALWCIDAEGTDFSEIPGYGTILEIGFTPSYRSNGNGKELVAYIEECLSKKKVTSCYVSAYGPAQSFWESCGYKANGQVASNGLPIMVKSIS